MIEAILNSAAAGFGWGLTAAAAAVGAATALLVIVALVGAAAKLAGLAFHIVTSTLLKVWQLTGYNPRTKWGQVIAGGAKQSEHGEKKKRP